MSTFLVLKLTRAFLQASFCLPQPMDKKSRKSWLLKYGQPEGNETRCLKLVCIIWGELPKEELQNFVLGAAGSLVVVFEELTSQDDLNPDQIVHAIQQSLSFLGNMVAHFSQGRSTRALAHFNPDLKSLLEDVDFSKAIFLFRPGFEKKAKERSEAVRCLRKATSFQRNGKRR